MRKLALFIALVAFYGFSVTSGEAAQNAASQPAQAAAQTQKVTPAERAGRFVTTALNWTGSALKWTGKAAQDVASSAGKGVTNLVNSFSSSNKQKP